MSFRIQTLPERYPNTNIIFHFSNSSSAFWLTVIDVESITCTPFEMTLGHLETMKYDTGGGKYELKEDILLFSLFLQHIPESRSIGSIIYSTTVYLENKNETSHADKLGLYPDPLTSAHRAASHISKFDFHVEFCLAFSRYEEMTRVERDSFFTHQLTQTFPSQKFAFLSVTYMVESMYDPGNTDMSTTCNQLQREILRKKTSNPNLIHK